MTVSRKAKKKPARARTVKATARQKSGDPTRAVERPAGLTKKNVGGFGSDVVADMLRSFDFPYVAVTPGASFRGLHDSLVNHLGNESPQMLVCLHEEHTIAIAQGYAKVTGKPLAAVVHSNVGLFHATMAFFNAWCDRMPAFVLGATGPVDAMKRRPWIEWIHTARDQASQVRHYVKWDDQPGSIGAIRESMIRAKWLGEAYPKAPTYIVLDAELQEMPFPEPLPELDHRRYAPAIKDAASPEEIAAVVALISKAKRPVIMAGRVSRDRAGWDARVALAEAIGARVVTDVKIACSFPTDHPLHAGVTGLRLDAEGRAALKDADLIISLDWLDLGGTLHGACGGAPKGTVVQVSLDHTLHNGWSMDYQVLPPVDLLLAADPDAVVPELLKAVGGKPKAAPGKPRAFPVQVGPRTGPITVTSMGHRLRKAVGDRPVSFVQLPLGWEGDIWPFRDPLDYLGTNGGGGVGGGPGISVGAALALRGSGRLPIAILGDGDTSMGGTALWTATHYRIPLLVVVYNNQSYFNDEEHQERMAIARKRPKENRWIGQRMDDPPVDYAKFAESMGAVGIGPITKPGDLDAAYARAIKIVDDGGVAVVDVHVASKSKL